MNITITQENDFDFTLQEDGSGGMYICVNTPDGEEYIIGGVDYTGNVWWDVETIVDSGLDTDI
jgi:hypothetical protein